MSAGKGSAAVPTYKDGIDDLGWLALHLKGLRRKATTDADRHGLGFPEALVGKIHETLLLCEADPSLCPFFGPLVPDAERPDRHGVHFFTMRNPPGFEPGMPKPIAPARPQRPGLPKNTRRAAAKKAVAS